MLYGEIHFIGLCTFINLRDLDKEIIRPSLLMPVTPEGDDKHIAFIAYDTKAVTTDSSKFEDISSTSSFRWYRLSGGWTIDFPQDEDGIPTLLPSFATIAHAEQYWPRSSKHAWNHRFVPKRDDLPNSKAVEVVVRLGAGELSADRLGAHRWAFHDKQTGHVLIDRFSEVAIYRFAIGDDGSLKLRLKEFETDDPQDIEFTLPEDAPAPISVWVGSCGESYVERALAGTLQTGDPQPGTHFRYLHGKKCGKNGPIPVPFSDTDTDEEIGLKIAHIKSEKARARAKSNKADPGDGRGEYGLCGPDNGGPG